MLSSYLVDITILLVAAVVSVPIAQSVRLGAVPGFLIAGVIVGPYALGLIANVDAITHIAEIGVVFLLFIIGIELKPSRLWQMRRLVFGLGSLQVLGTGAIIGYIGHHFFGLSIATAILVGPTLALSSTAFVLQLLSEQKLLSSLYGRASISILLLQDIAVVPLLALVPLLSKSEWSLGAEVGIALGESVLIIALVILLGRYLLHPVLAHVARSGNSEVFTALAVLLVLGTALVTEHAGLSMAMGAFLAGLLISDSIYRHQVIAEIQPFRGVLLGLFFMTMGTSLNLNLLLDQPLTSLELVLLLIGIKALSLYPLVRLFKLNHKNSLAIAMLLAQSGEFALVLFSLAYQSQLLPEQLFQQLLLAVLLSMLLTPLLAAGAHRLILSQDHKNTLLADRATEQPIVLAGFGRVGHRIGEILNLVGKSFVALDGNADVVMEQRQAGHPVFFGDVRKPEVLKSAGAAQAKVIIVTINDPKAAEALVQSLKQTYPNSQIFARGHSMLQCQRLKKLGASGVVSENIEASLGLARMALDGVGVEESMLEEILSNFRKSYDAQINE